MKKLYIILLLLIGFQFFAIGQNNPVFPGETHITLSGEIIDKESGEVLPYVNIINKSTDQGTTSDLKGKFEIAIHPTDTIIFSSVGFEKVVFILGEKERKLDHHRVKITLAPSTYELAPVRIYAFKDEAAFKQEILNLELPEDPNAKITIPGSYYGPPPPVDHNAGFSLGSPLTSIRNAFSKEAKELRKYAEALETYPRQKTINSKYNREVVEKVTGLKDKELNDFMLFCKIPDDFILKANEYEIILAINACYKDFLHTKN